MRFLFNRLLRWRLRTLLLIVTALSAALGWYVANARERAAEVATLRRIDDLSGYGILERAYDDDKFGWCGTGYNGRVRLTGRGPQWLHKLLTLAGCDVLYRTESISVYGSEIDDSAVGPLAALRSVEWVDLYSEGITYEGFLKLRRALPNARINYCPPEPSPPVAAPPDPLANYYLDLIAQ